MGSNGIENGTSVAQKRSSSVGRMIRSISQAFGISNPQFNAHQIVSYDNGNFCIKIDKLEEILDDGSNTDIINLLKLLQTEMVNIISDERLEVWEIIKSKVNLKKESSIRSEAFKVLRELLNFNEVPKTKGLEFYIDICENVNLNGIDKDMKLILICFHELVTYSDLNCFEKYNDHPLNDFLIKLYYQILTYGSEELEVLVISLISQCIEIDKHLFILDDLQDLFNSIIKISIKTSNMLVIKSFLDFFQSFLLTGYKYDDNIYTILSILGCANGFEDLEASEECESLIDKILLNDKTSQIPFIICDVIVERYDDKFQHRKGNRPIIGCLRFLSYTLKYIELNSNEGKIITSFYEHHLNYLFEALISLAKDSDDIVSIEILKFIDEVLEKPYTINGYYKYFIERNDFWDLLKLLNWKNNLESESNSYQVVLNELFNKLQNFELNNFYISKLVEYLENNFQILSSYNISFVLQFYLKNHICVCGALNWKTNCENIVKKYYLTTPYDVLNVLKESVLYCIPLKIDKPSLDFYINIIFYDCVIGLNFSLDDDVIEPITDILLKLDDKFFEKIVNDYEIEIKNCKDRNIRLMCKILIILTLKGSNLLATSKKMEILINSIVKITDYTQKINNSSIFIACILLLTRIRSCRNDSQKSYYIAEFKNEEISGNTILSRNGITDNKSNKENQGASDEEGEEEDIRKIDSQINQIFEEHFRDVLFEKEIAKYFTGGKTRLINIDINFNILLELYIKILSNTDDWEHYFIILKNLRNQLLNYELFLDDCSNLIELIKLFTQQMQFIYTFNFDTPHWIKIKHIRIAIIDVLYGIFPYKKIIPLRQGEDLLRSIVLDFHFCDITRISYLNFLNSCMFELPEIMKHFILPILKMINDDISKPQTLFSNLEFFLSLFELKSKNIYTLTEKELKLIPNILNEIVNYQIEEYDKNYNEIKCSKFLANLILSKLELSGKRYNSLNIKLKSKIRFIKIDNDNVDNEFSRIFEDINDDFKVDKMSENFIDFTQVDAITVNNPNQLYNIKDNDMSMINIVFSNKDIDDSIIEDCLNRKIIVTSIEENDSFFSISNYGFDYMNMHCVVIEKFNIKSFVTVLVELCSISNLSKTE